MYTKFAVVLGLALHPLATPGSFQDPAFSSRVAPRHARQSPERRARVAPVTNDLQVFIAAQRSPIPEDQPIAIVFHVINVGTANFDFGWCRSSWQPNFTVMITTESGEPVPRSKPDPAVGSGMGWRIVPGGEKVEVGDLRDEFALKPGRYYVTATENYETAGGPRPHATSNTIKIRVVAAPRDPTPGLRLVSGARLVFDRPEEVDETMRLTNRGEQVIAISPAQGQPWFHSLALDFRTLSGNPVPRRHGPDGREVPFDADVWGLYAHQPAAPGPLRPGDYLDGGVLLYKVYNLIPGTAYTLVTHVTLQTSDGPVELVSNTVTFVIRAK